MELRYWVATFKALHDRARKGELSSAERAQYLAQREELARALVVAQRLVTLPDQTARQTLRVARALHVELELLEGRQRVVTQHLSSRGFGAVVPKELVRNTAIGFSLRLPSTADPIVGRVKVLDVQARTGEILISFAFNELGAADLERLELLLFDTILQQFEGMAF